MLAGKYSSIISYKNCRNVLVLNCAADSWVMLLPLRYSSLRLVAAHSSDSEMLAMAVLDRSLYLFR